MLRGRRSGITVLELVVVIAIITLLMAMIFPAIQLVRAAADRQSCLSRLRQIGIAQHNYHADYTRFTPTGIALPTNRTFFSLTLAFVGWQAALLPYIEQDRLWHDTIADCLLEPLTFQSPPHRGQTTVVPLYVCPVDRRLLSVQAGDTGRPGALTSYLGISGGISNDGIFGMRHGCRLEDIYDGASYTLMIGERPPPDTFKSGWWYPALLDGAWPDFSEYQPWLRLLMEIPAPRQIQFDAYYRKGRTDNPLDRWHYWSLHPGGGNFLFAGGNARFIPYSARPIMVPLATRDGGDPVQLDE
jgi:prepilin-type processing-associated H-X9-DG protein